MIFLSKTKTKIKVLILVLFTSNNIFITILNCNKYILYKKSLGMQRPKGLKKLTQSSVRNISNEISNFLKLKGLNKFHLKLKGLNKFKKLMLKTLIYNLYKNKNENQILSIMDENLIAYNGCKLKKQKRL